MAKKKWEIKTIEPEVDINSERAKYSYYQSSTVEADIVDTVDGMLMFLNVVRECDEVGFMANKKELVAGYTIANIVSFKEVTNEQTSETPV